MMDKRRSHKSSPSLIACRLATETWRADSRCVRQSVWVGRFGGGVWRGTEAQQQGGKREAGCHRKTETWYKTLDVSIHFMCGVIREGII